MCDHRELLVHFTDSFTAKRYTAQFVEPVMLALLQGTSNTVFQEDNVRPHVTWQTFNNPTGFDIYPLPGKSPDLNPIE